MGTINIRFRQQGLGNLPGVRQVDTSPLRDVANQDMASARALAGTIDDLVQGGLRLGNALVEMRAEDNKNEANKLYKDYVTQMDGLTSQAADPNNPNAKEGLFLTAERDDAAAKALADDLRKGQADKRKAIGLDKQNARVKELFEEMAWSYDRGNALRADAIMAKRFHESRTANAAAATETARIQAAKTPTAESFDTYARLLEDGFDANGLPEGERVLKRKAAQEGLLTAILAERVKTGSLAETGALLKALAQDTLPTQVVADERSHAFLQETLKGLAPEVKATLIKALETERDTLAGRQVDAMVTAQYEGFGHYDAFVAQRDAMRAAGVPESILARANGVVEAELQSDSNVSIRGLPDDVKNATDPETAEKLLDAYEATLPDHVRYGAAWQTFRAQAKRVSPKTAVAMKKEAADKRVAQIVDRWQYDENGLRVKTDLGQSEQLEAVAFLWRTGQLNDADYQDACNKINAFWDARVADLVQQSTLAGDFLDGFSYNIEGWAAQNGAKDINLATIPYAFVFDKTGIDEAKTASNLLALFNTAEDSEAQRARRLGLIRERLSKAESAFAKAIAENPSWTPEQCRKLWRELMREPLYALGNAAFEMDANQSAKWQRTLGALYQAAEPNALWDYDADQVLNAFQKLDLTLVPSKQTGAPYLSKLVGAEEPIDPDEYKSVEVDYVTQEGDTAESVIAKYGLRPEWFSALTGLAPEGPLEPGQRLPLIDATQGSVADVKRRQGGQPAQASQPDAPTPQAAPAPEEEGIKPRDPNLRDLHPSGKVYEAEDGKRYTIPRGERTDLAKLAIRFGVSLDDLRKLNPDLPTDADGTIRWGNTIKLPASATQNNTKESN